MKPINFKETNVTFAKDQKQYMPLVALKTEAGEVVTCWEFSFAERLRVLFGGKLWLCISTFNKPLQPIFMTTEKNEILVTAPNINENES